MKGVEGVEEMKGVEGVEEIKGVEGEKLQKTGKIIVPAGLIETPLRR